MATTRFRARLGLDNNSNSITNLGVSGASLTRVGAHSLTFTTSADSNVTLPTSGTLIGSADTATVTNTMLAGSIANNKLANSSVTVGTTAISLGSSSTTIAGLTSITSISSGGNQATFGYDSTNKFNFNIGSDGVIYTDCMGTQGYMSIRHANNSYAGLRLGLWTEATGVANNVMIAHNALTHTGSTYGNYALRQSSAGDTFINASSTKSLSLCNNNTAILTVDGTGAYGKIIPKVNSTVTSNTITPNADTDNMLSATGLTAGLTIANHSGTPQNGQKLMVRVKDNGTSRTLTFGTAYVQGGVALPTATTAGKMTHLGFIYDTGASKWMLIASVTET